MHLRRGAIALRLHTPNESIKERHPQELPKTPRVICNKYLPAQGSSPRSQRRPFFVRGCSGTLLFFGIVGYMNDLNRLVRQVIAEFGRIIDLPGCAQNKQLPCVRLSDRETSAWLIYPNNPYPAVTFLSSCPTPAPHHFPTNVQNTHEKLKNLLLINISNYVRRSLS